MQLAITPPCGEANPGESARSRTTRLTFPVSEKTISWRERNTRDTPCHHLDCSTVMPLLVIHSGRNVPDLFTYRGIPGPARRDMTTRKHLITSITKLERSKSASPGKFLLPQTRVATTRFMQMPPLIVRVFVADTTCSSISTAHRIVVIFPVRIMFNRIKKSLPGVKDLPTDDSDQLSGGDKAVGEGSNDTLQMGIFQLEA